MAHLDHLEKEKESACVRLKRCMSFQTSFWIFVLASGATIAMLLRSYVSLNLLFLPLSVPLAYATYYSFKTYWKTLVTIENGVGNWPRRSELAK